ncbi:MAG: helix-turn-helix transcriptional regulator [Tyzzerella sp.]|nr:helix-turn-helix transcriptional regulator [Tyzzerella sp.]
MVYENIRNLRKKYDKLQIELAMYLNVRQTTYSKYELGKIELPLDILLKLADFYDVSIDYIVGRSTNDGSFKEQTNVKKK